MTPTAQATLVVRRDRLSRWFAGHHGIATLDRVLECGFSKSTAYRMARAGELELILPGVFKGAQWPTGREQRLAAACMRNENISIGFVTAGEVWAFRKVVPDIRIHLLVPHSCSVDFAEWSDDYVVHRCRQIDAVDIVERDDGIRVTSPTRALFDIADHLGDSVTASILEQLINDGRGTFETHLGTLVRLGRPGRPGTATMTRVIHSRPKWRRALQSDLEARVWGEIRRQGLPEPVIQFPLLLPDGRTIRLDFAWPQFKIALEVDHPFWHAGGDESHRDKRRDLLAATLGWRTVRITDFDVQRFLMQTVEEVGEVIALAATARR